MQLIDFQQMKDIEKHGSATIVNVLPAEYFEQTHIPNSINIPYASEAFAQKVQTIAGGTDFPVVLYCASRTCDKSRKAAQALVDAGFSNVMCYVGGTKEWQEKIEKIARESSAA